MHDKIKILNRPEPGASGIFPSGWLAIALAAAILIVFFRDNCSPDNYDFAEPDISVILHIEPSEE